MAQINQINGVSTSGTTGVNNLFGSGGGGGSPTQSVTPTFTADSQIRFAQTITITNHASFTQGVQYKVVTSLGGTDFDTQITTDSVINVSDNQVVAGTRTITVTAQEYGDFYESAEATSTYTKASTAFRYYRAQATNADGTTRNKSSLGFEEFRLYSGAGQTGTQYPENLTSNTSGETNGYYVDSDYTFSSASYDYWRAFDSNVNSWHWTLVCPDADRNFSGFHFDATVFPTVPSVSSWRFKSYNPDTPRVTLYGSNTGAFTGEETSLDVIDPEQNGLRVMINRG
jgi:hypothetical protein